MTAQEAIDAVMALHVDERFGDVDICSADGQLWPCPTVVTVHETGYRQNDERVEALLDVAHQVGLIGTEKVGRDAVVRQLQRWSRLPETLPRRPKEVQR